MYPVRKLKRKERLKMGLLKLGEVAEKTGVLPSAVRYYANMGLLKVSGYTQGKYRLFDRDDTLSRMARIKELKNEGFTLTEIKKKLR